MGIKKTEFKRKIKIIVSSTVNSSSALRPFSMVFPKLDKITHKAPFALTLLNFSLTTSDNFIVRCP